jgi:hypothetical protein
MITMGASNMQPDIIKRIPQHRGVAVAAFMIAAAAAIALEFYADINWSDKYSGFTL